MINRPKTREAPPITVRVMEEWDWEKYKELASETKIKIAKGLKELIDEIIKRENIDLQPVFRKLYVPYQAGRSNVFWIDIGYTSWTTGDVLITFKLDKEPDLSAEGIEIEHTKTKWFEKYSFSVISVIFLSPLFGLHVNIFIIL